METKEAAEMQVKNQPLLHADASKASQNPNMIGTVDYWELLAELRIG